MIIGDTAWLTKAVGQVKKVPCVTESDGTHHAELVLLIDSDYFKPNFNTT